MARKRHRKPLDIIPGYVGPRPTEGVSRLTPPRQDDIVCYTRDFVKRSGLRPAGLPLNGRVVRLLGTLASVLWNDRDDGQVIMVHVGNLIRYDERHLDLP